MGTDGKFDEFGTVKVDRRVQDIEATLESLLADSVEDELVVQEVAVAPRSKLRVACE